MDVRYINPFITATCSTFQTMCATPVTVGKPELKTGEDPFSDVSAIIGFSGDATGAVALHLSFDAAIKTATRFAGIEMDPEHPDFADALGELADMVAGGAKDHFEGLNIDISLPSVIVGKAHGVAASRSAPRLIIPCRTDLGNFSVEVGMVMDKAPARIKKAEATGAIL
jgi:chemotaxis protein CheX